MRGAKAMAQYKTYGIDLAKGKDMTVTRGVKIINNQIKFNIKSIIQMLKSIKIDGKGIAGKAMLPFAYLYVYVKGFVLLRRMRIDISNNA